MTHEKFWGSVFYVDHHSDYMYTHLITGTTSQATLESKLAYKRVASAHGVQAKAYHANNLRFNEKNFTGSCINEDQQLSYCGVLHTIKILWWNLRLRKHAMVAEQYSFMPNANGLTSSAPSCGLMPSKPF